MMRKKMLLLGRGEKLASLNVGGAKHQAKLPARLDMIYVLDHGVGDAYRDDLKEKNKNFETKSGLH